jgi:hypothetical protein
MAEKPKTTDTTPPEAPVKVYPGGVTQDQIDRWKAEHGDVTIIRVKVARTGETLGAILRPLNKRQEYFAALSMAEKDKPGEAGDFILKNCWLGGDERLKSEETAYVTACVKAYNSVEFYDAEVEKV